jgi:hypothetical protein
VRVADVVNPLRRDRQSRRRPLDIHHHRLPILRPGRASGRSVIPSFFDDRSRASRIVCCFCWSERPSSGVGSSGRLILRPNITIQPSARLVACEGGDAGWRAVTLPGNRGLGRWVCCVGSLQAPSSSRGKPPTIAPSGADRQGDLTGKNIPGSSIARAGIPVVWGLFGDREEMEQSVSEFAQHGGFPLDAG